MAGPWDNYADPNAPKDGPWTNYQAPAPPGPGVPPAGAVNQNDWGFGQEVASQALLGSGPQAEAFFASRDPNAPSDAYSQALSHYRQMQQEWAQNNPKTAIAARLLGQAPMNIATGLALGPLGLAGRGLGWAAQSGATNAGQAAIEGGSGEDIAKAGGLGALIGAGGEAVTSLGSKVVNALLGRGATTAKQLEEGVKPQSQADLFKTSRQHYTDIENSTAAYQPNSFANLSQDMGNLATSKFAALPPSTFPAAGDALEMATNLARTGAPVSPLQIEGLRQVLNSAKAGSPDEALARQMIGKIDGFYQNATPADMVRGDPQLIADQANRARMAWAAGSRSEKLTDPEAAADVHTAARPLTRSTDPQYRAIAENLLAKDANPGSGASPLEGWTDEEKGALKDVIAGSPTRRAAEAVARIGHATPFEMTMGTLGAMGEAGLSGHPEHLLALPAAYAGGKVAGAILDAQTRGRMAVTDALLRSRGTPETADALRAYLTSRPPPISLPTAPVVGGANALVQPSGGPY
jgi:hypothetical protein